MGTVEAAPLPPPSASEEDLLLEIEHLRQMLADAREEKNIQVEIVRDEVAEKQRVLEVIQRQRLQESEALSRAREQICALEALEAGRVAEREALRAARAESERLRAELGRLQAASAAPSLMSASLEKAEQIAGHGSSPAERAELEQLRAEVARLQQAEGKADDLLAEIRATLARARAELGGGSRAAASPTASADDSLQARLLSLRDVAVAVRADAERIRGGAARRQRITSRDNLEAAQALREVRQNSERQLAWMMKRLRLADASTEAPGLATPGLATPGLVTPSLVSLRGPQRGGIAVN